MSGAVRVLLIGGTSNTGKSSVARELADRLGHDCRTTDTLARHPGRPWRTPTWEVPTHVAEHYRTLTVDQLVESVLEHYLRLWPQVEELITPYTTGDGPGLVLEGSALWPAWVAELALPHTAAVWLAADEAALRERVHAGGDYRRASAQERYLMDKFLARTVRYQELMLEALAARGLPELRVRDGRSVAEVAGDVLVAAG